MTPRPGPEEHIVIPAQRVKSPLSGEEEWEAPGGRTRPRREDPLLDGPQMVPTLPETKGGYKVKEERERREGDFPSPKETETGWAGHRLDPRAPLFLGNQHDHKRS